ncbi:proto-oncogene tyrosine-protein kinase ros [Lasius niger]|uniref:receptor protein-tyrosine kinase n=1 Tax=Lasius niger TaxID=67767 RepID=A0A0J7MZ63_LASNI|nr:proto-oncogene tyrosine-protein kinase ros [Lasius niger]
MDEFGMTKIKKEQINRSNLIGSGTIGQVFQGTVKDLGGSDVTPVAIKMLQESASSQKKMKFLNEAKLMSQFCHKNVLKLLGSCLDVDPPLLILELMEAGDLLNYLRESRTLEPSDPHALRLQDLLAMCEDVARGCCYLEGLHIAHKDLACRNCLVSARNRENRIVKIGNFGLDRDIYKDDYYHMKGKDILYFLSWMAPECLKYQKFTSQSDVWAFGVLMWEITFLGEHPYTVKNKSEISQYVSEGIKLPKPLNCPPTLYELMQQCWNVEANDRPNFTHCLQNILILRDNIEDAVLSSIDINRPVKFPPSGQIEDLVRSTANVSTLEHLTTNDASNDVRTFDVIVSLTE